MDIKLIDTIYKLNIDTVTQNIDDNYKEQIKEGYRGYLEDMYKDYDFEDETFEEACNRNMDIENFRWNNMSNEEKLSELIEDKSFEEIKQISQKGYTAAKKRICQKDINQKTMDEMFANKNIENLINLLPQVCEFNYQLANSLAAEGVKDLLYASGQTELLSMRINGEYGNIKQK